MPAPLRAPRYPDGFEREKNLSYGRERTYVISKNSPRDVSCENFRGPIRTHALCDASSRSRSHEHPNLTVHVVPLLRTHNVYGDWHSCYTHIPRHASQLSAKFAATFDCPIESVSSDYAFLVRVCCRPRRFSVGSRSDC
ncbi:hypothetical protein GWI33_018810 [Rhynchophorus ferrugineus]|uniref:Uncharacterized protein n=1 Tax=Rhynchophorus ferrugineus TaxID=354439 RepID=A0A834HVM2_RHYFE|nr:hypothetical protein GWI33_018810 [Rhynchophorus ferrugineus]